MKYNKEVKKAYDLLKKRVIKYYGPRCKDFEISCICCQQWMALDILIDVLREE